MLKWWIKFKDEWLDYVILGVLALALVCWFNMDAIMLLPSPRGARAASARLVYLPEAVRVAVPVGGRRLHLEMIPWSAIQTGRTLLSPRGVRVASLQK